jgi:deazaflavin-dependent oxidoreductase (nitroreductase family)
MFGPARRRPAGAGTGGEGDDHGVPDLADAADDAFCYLTTRGRVTGEPHEIEIWFAYRAPGTLYLLAGGRDRSDWVRNLVAEPAVTVRVRDHTHDATARVLEAGTDEDARARALVFEKYDPDYDGSLASWRESSLPVAIDVA